jgi:hypothetical protein
VSAFWCQNCGLVCDWNTRAPAPSEVEIKTIASRYCNDESCIEAEARAHGVPVERVMQWRNVREGFGPRGAV